MSHLWTGRIGTDGEYSPAFIDATGQLWTQVDECTHWAVSALDLHLEHSGLKPLRITHEHREYGQIGDDELTGFMNQIATGHLLSGPRFVHWRTPFGDVLRESWSREVGAPPIWEVVSIASK